VEWVSNLTHVIAKEKFIMHGLNLKLMKDSLWPLFRGAFLTIAAMGMLLAATSAQAACGDPTGSKSGVVPKLPFLVQFSDGTEPSSAEAHQGSESGREGRHNDSIVGLWHVKYTSGGQPFFESFDQWHSDGTELENPNLPPATGPLCVGVWKQTGPRTVRLHHVGWNFDFNGNSTGTFTLDESNTVAQNERTYEGTFDYKIYDVNGNLIQEVTGTQTATRITVN
jgi:hypothetical protein